MRCVHLRLIVILILFSLLTVNIFSLEDVQSNLNQLLPKLDEAKNLLYNNKITEARNLLWEEVDPNLQEITNYIDNNIQTLNSVGIYNLDGINLSYGDIKKGKILFDKAKIDSDYAINEMDFEEKISKEKDVINELKETSFLTPEIGVTYAKKNEELKIKKSTLNIFSINVKDIETYSDLMDMDINSINNKFNIEIDEVIYTYTNIDENNKSIVIKELNKKINSVEPIKDVEIYEVFPEYTNMSNLIFRSTHEFENNKNRVLLFKGTLYQDRTIPVYLIIESNESSDQISQTLFILHEEKPIVIISNDTNTQIKNNTNINQNNNLNGSKNETNLSETIILERQNNFPYIVLGILIIILFILILNNIMKKDKITKDLEKYRRRINTLKGNV